MQREYWSAVYNVFQQNDLRPRYLPCWFTLILFRCSRSRSQVEGQGHVRKTRAWLLLRCQIVAENNYIRLEFGSCEVKTSCRDGVYV